MSWSQYLADVDVDGIKGAEPCNPLSDGPLEQFDLAKHLAVEAIESGAVGDPAKHRFSVSLSGHANPDHEPAEGYGNDCLSVSISQALAQDE